ncbi:MAG: hypothetical protein KDH19_05215, partial [Geminicoccaceae bacterium]|nr:hypothetical protein [Geminicoccaceae bacterium]
MRKLSLTAIATIMAASAAASAQAQDCGTDCVVAPIEINLQDELYLTGTGGLKLSNVKVVVPDLDVVVTPPLALDNAIEAYQSNSGNISATK